MLKITLVLFFCDSCSFLPTHAADIKAKFIVEYSGILICNDVDFGFCIFKKKVERRKDMHQLFLSTVRSACNKHIQELESALLKRGPSSPAAGVRHWNIVFTVG